MAVSPAARHWYGRFLIVNVELLLRQNLVSQHYETPHDLVSILVRVRTFGDSVVASQQSQCLVSPVALIERLTAFEQHQLIHGHTVKSKLVKHRFQNVHLAVKDRDLVT